MTCNRILVVLIFSCISVVSVAQDDWVFSTHSNNITGISFDSTWIWASTREGVFRIRRDDGSIKQVTTSNSNISANYLTDILAVGEDSVWAALYYFGASLSDTVGAEWQNFKQEGAGLTSNFVRTLDRAPSGAVYMGTFYGGVNIYDHGQWSYLNTSNSPLPVDNAHGGIVEIDFYSDSTDVDVYMGTRYKGLYHRYLEASGDTTWEYFNVFNSPIPNLIISGLEVDYTGQVWIGTHDGLAVKNGEEWYVFDHQNSPLPSSFVHSIAIDHDSVAWLALDEGLVAIPISAVQDTSAAYYQWIVYNEDNSGLPSRTIERVAVDPVTGDLWVGTYSQGLVRYDGNEWQVFDFEAGNVIVDNDITALDFTSDSVLLASTATGGLGVFEDSSWTIYSKSNGLLDDNQIRAAHKDHQGNIWLAYSYSGIAMINDTQIVTYNHLNSPINYPYNFANDLYIDSSDVIWLAVNNGLWKCRPLEDEWTFIPGKGGDDFQDVTTIEPAQGDGFWYGGRFGTIKLFDGDSIVAEYDTPDSIFSNAMVIDLELDEWNNLWVGTFSDGLWRLDTAGNWTHFDGSNSELMSTSIAALKYLPDSTLWIGTTGNGIYVYDFVLDQFNHYSVYSGHLPEGNVNDFALDKASGTLWLGMAHTGLGQAHVDIYMPPDTTTPPDTTEVPPNLKFIESERTVPLDIPDDWELAGTAGDETIDLSPNPVKNGEALLTYSLAQKSNVLISIYRENGRLVKEIAPGQPDRGRCQEWLDLSDLPKGRYFLVLFADGRPKVMAFLVL